MAEHPLTGNPYAADPDHTETKDGRGVTAALMAIAFEQRTANLLDIRAVQVEAAGSGWGIPELRRQIAAIDNEILRCLGLKDEA